MQLHPTSRGVGLWNDKVFFARPTQCWVALDVKTSREAHHVLRDRPSEASAVGFFTSRDLYPIRSTAKVGDYKKGYYMSLAPLGIDGKVLVGVSGGELGVRGFVAAYDAQTGKELWKSYTVPPRCSAI